MKPARIIVLLIALGAAGGAALLMMNSEATPPVVVERTAPVATSDVLVAAGDVQVGQTLTRETLRWQPWPADYVPNGSIVKSGAPGALEEVTGSIARQNILAGEPVRRERLVRADGAGFMAAILPSGMRAVAITIDTRGANAAGGFILPNDRVDVLRIFRDDEASKAGNGEVQTSETILSNIRVLAIGQKIQEQNGEKVVTGETATLELTPVQAEVVILGQRTGQLSLVLRSLADAKTVDTQPIDRADAALTVVRFGVARPVPRR